MIGQKFCVGITLLQNFMSKVYNLPLCSKFSIVALRQGKIKHSSYLLSKYLEMFPGLLR